MNTNKSSKRVEQISDALKKYQFARSTRQQAYQDLKKDIKRKHTELKSTHKAKHVLVVVSEETQKKFKYHVESLVGKAVAEVWPNRAFEFVLEFNKARGRWEVQPTIIENGEPYIPKDDMGGGIIDVIGFALRLVLWHLQQPRTRNVLILDEPLKWTGRLMTKAAMIIKTISNELGIQIIMNTHDDALIDIGDVAYHFTNTGEGTEVEKTK